ncbi:MAG TPA: GNAT family N-acetyltransferase, partial [Rhodothermales bacterium]|nr:GNAT family N-acetyltransferase [Rhodothermales bacterium]
MPAPSLPLTYTIETPRCRLRVPAVTDLPHIFEATRYPGFNEGMLWEPPDTLDELDEPLRRSLEAWQAAEKFSFSIDLRASGTFAGRISIRPTDEPRRWNIGFWLHPQHQGNGYMREAATAILRFGFETLAAEVIEACYATWNTPSERVLKAIGMTFEKHLP